MQINADQCQSVLIRGGRFSIYNVFMPETKPFRLTESVKAAG